MKVVFLQNIKGMAQIGDIKDVNAGYARNFLLPRKLALRATPETVKQSETLKQKRVEGAAVNKERALELVKKLEGTTLEINEDANEEGHLYGSIGKKKIVQIFKKQKINFTEDQINLPEHIKQVGEYEVELELHPEVKIKIKILVLKK